jgi:hypothetical protein
VFGERESEFNVAGYVPSLKPDGPIRVGSDQMRAAMLVQDKAMQKAKAQVKSSPCYKSIPLNMVEHISVA